MENNCNITLSENNETNPDAIFNDEELIKIWINMLLEKYNKRFTIYLTIDEITSEIKEVKQTIENEKIWANTDSIHESNISTLNSYLHMLNGMLETRQKFEKSKQEHRRKRKC